MEVNESGVRQAIFATLSGKTTIGAASLPLGAKAERLPEKLIADLTKICLRSTCYVDSTNSNGRRQCTGFR